MIKPHKTPPRMCFHTLYFLLGSHQSFNISSEPHPSSPLSISSNADPFPELVSKISTILSSPTWERSSELSHLVPKLKPHHVVNILDTHNNTESVLRFFHWVSRRHFFKHDMSCFVSMLNRLVRDRLFVPADNVRILMIKSCRNEGEVKRVIQVLSEINTTYDFGHTLYSFSTLLIQLGKFDMDGLARDAYVEMLNSGIRPSLFTFNAMIKNLCNKGKVQEAELIMGHIFHYGACPDTFTYTSLIIGHCRNRNLDLAFEMFDRMVKDRCDPNSVTYSTLINGLCREGRLEEAMNMLEEMIEKGIEPTIHAYTIPIVALCDAGRSCEAVKLLGKMKKRGCGPNVQTYTALICGLSRDGKFEVAIGVYHKMLADGLVPTAVTYSALINQLYVEGRFETALTIFNWMLSHDSLPNTETYNVIIKGFCSIGYIQKAMAIFDKMLKAGPSPNVITYNMIIHIYVKQGYMNNAMRLVEMMKGNGLKLDTWTYANLISGFSREGKLDHAFSLFNEMVEHGISPNVVTYNAIINGYLTVSKVDDALALFWKMVESGNLPSSGTYNMMISGFSKANRISEAENFCGKMVKQGLLPNVITYTSFIDGLCKNGRTSLAFKIFHEMEKRDFFPNLCTYSSLIYGLCQEGRAEDAERLLDEMEKKGITPPKMPPEPPLNFWGDQPEEEFYASQGVRNTKSFFETPHGKLFTQSFIPLDSPDLKGTVYMTHGYGSDTGWMFQKICLSYASWGYAVFAADLLGHGRSDGLRCYLGDMDKIAAASLSFFLHTRRSEPYRHLPAFLFGESMGGAATMLMYFQSDPDTWTGLIFSAPLFVIPENMKPSKLRLFLYGLLFGVADTWAAMPDNKMVGKAIKDPEKLKIIAANPRRYTGPPRVGTMRELVRVTQYIRDNFSKVTAPFLTVHGTADGVTCPSSSQLLYEKAASVDKTLKLYDGMYHSLIQGEPDENVEIVLRDMREWIDERALRYGPKK